jgi:hypothetical protein
MERNYVSFTSIYFNNNKFWVPQSLDLQNATTSVYGGRKYNKMERLNRREIREKIKYFDDDFNWMIID